jgi:hypothetical protein
MTTRALPYLLLLPGVGVLVGSGLAGLASAPSNDPCFSSEYLQEGTSSSSSLELWPLGLRCDYLVGTPLERSMFLGPTTAELYAWIAAATLLAALALLMRDRAYVRGAAGAANLLAVVGLAWQAAGVPFAFFIAVVLGAPLAFPLDHLLRPASTRSARASLLVAIALAALTFCAIIGIILIPVVGIAIGVLGGALASARLARAHVARTPATADARDIEKPRRSGAFP